MMIKRDLCTIPVGSVSAVQVLTIAAAKTSTGTQPRGYDVSFTAHLQRGVSVRAKLAASLTLAGHMRIEAAK